MFTTSTVRVITVSEYINDSSMEQIAARITPEQVEFFKSHPLLNKSSVIRKGIDLYIKELFNEDAYSEAEKEYLEHGGKL